VGERERERCGCVCVCVCVCVREREREREAITRGAVLDGRELFWMVERERVVGLFCKRVL